MLRKLSSQGCLNGYKEYAGSCYKHVKTLTTRHSAQADCEVDGANLVSIGDGGENEFIREMFR